MPGLGNILLALTGGAVQGYAQQKAQQRAAKTHIAMETLMKYPEVAADLDFAKFAQSADIDKEALGPISHVMQIRQNLLNANQQAQLKNMGDFIQKLNGGAPAQEGVPAGALPPSPIDQFRAQRAATNTAAPGAGMPPATAPTGPASAQTPGFAQAAQQQAPAGISGAIPPPPRPRIGFKGATMGPQGLSYNIGEMTPTGAEQQARSFQTITQYMRDNPNVPPGEAVDRAVAAGWPVTPQMKQHVLEEAGRQAFAALGPVRSSDDEKAKVRYVQSTLRLPVPSDILQSAGLQTSADAAQEASAKAWATLEPEERKIAYQQAAEKAAHSTVVADETGKEVQLSPEQQKGAREIVNQFNAKMKNGPQLAKNLYQTFVGFMADPQGVSQSDILVTYARMAAAGSGGRISQKQIDTEKESGRPLSGVPRQIWNSVMNGNPLTDNQLRQMAKGAYNLYQGALSQEQDITKDHERLLRQQKIPTNILPKSPPVFDTTTGKPIPMAFQPSAPTAGTPAAAPPPAPGMKPPPPGVDPADWADAISRNLVK